MVKISRIILIKNNIDSDNGIIIATKNALKPIFTIKVRVKNF